MTVSHQIRAMRADRGSGDPPQGALPDKGPRRLGAVRRTGLRLLVLALPLASLSAPSPAGPPVSPGIASAAGSPGADRESALRQALALIRTDETDTARIRKAIPLLERAGAAFPDEIRIPLYLAEAWYRVADPDREIEKEFPLYENVGRCARAVLDREPGRTEARYWHGLFLLKKAQKTGGIRAYFLAREGVRELERVRKDMPAYDHGGASRVLALLHYTAPGWTPFGDVARAVVFAEEAVRIDPEYPLNRLYLAEAYHKRGDRDAAVREYRKLLEGSPVSPGRLRESVREEARRMLETLGVPADGSEEGSPAGRTPTPAGSR
jgi:tetratricopeptide (TPR) repeat protein